METWNLLFFNLGLPFNVLSSLVFAAHIPRMMVETMLLCLLDTLTFWSISSLYLVILFLNPVIRVWVPSVKNWYLKGKIYGLGALITNGTCHCCRHFSYKEGWNHVNSEFIQHFQCRSHPHHLLLKCFI